MKNKVVLRRIYFLLVVWHFLPWGRGWSLAFPLAFLTVCAFFGKSRLMVLAMLFSALGDCMGACGNFWLQLLSFAMAHVAFVGFFYQNARREGVSGGGTWKAMLLVAVLLAVYFLIGLHVKDVALRWGVMCYTALILMMCWAAWMQRSRWYVWGAWLFVLSDAVLAWNRFVLPIDGAGYWILIPYFLAQGVIFFRSCDSSV